MATSAEIIGAGSLAEGPSDRNLLEGGAAVGQHLRIERVARVSAGRVWYLANNIGPKWSRRKCWSCGNKYTPTMAQCCDYCLTPLKDQSFLMVAHDDEDTFSPFAELARLRIDHFGFLAPVAVIMRQGLMYAVYHYSGEQLLIDLPAPLGPQQLLSMAQGLGDVLHHLHQNGVVLGAFSAANVLIVPDGTARFFDPDVHEVVRPSRLYGHPRNPTHNDFAQLGKMLLPYVAPSNALLSDFFTRLSKGEIDGFRAFERAIEGIIMSGGARPVPGSAWSFTDTGLVRNNNEDCFGWRKLGDSATLYVVADGMGGHEAGEVASAIAVDTMIESLSRGATGKPAAYEKAVADAMKAANAAVFKYRKDHDITMGTTLVCVAHVAGEAVVGNAGDSRAYLLRKGTLLQLSRDHSVAQALVDSGKIKPEEARDHPRGNILTSTVGGMDELEEYDVSRVPLKPGDRLLLCTDGLWGEVLDNDIGRLLGNDPPQEAVRDLIRAALAAGGKDNVTVQVIQIP